MTHLDADLGQVHLHGQLFAGIDIGVVRLLKGPFQLVQLIGGERCAVASVLFLGTVVVLACRQK